MTKILESEKEKFDLRQTLDLMSHKDLCNKFIEAYNLLVISKKLYDDLCGKFIITHDIDTFLKSINMD